MTSKKQIRKEYTTHKKAEKKQINEKAFKWVKQNVILVNEQINRQAIKRLTDAVVKFDETFGPFKEKIPALAAKLERAEDGLSKAVTGRANDRKVSDMLQRMSYLYNSLSRFFSKDLAVILRTPLFLVPKSNPSTSLATLQAPSGSKYDPNAIRDAFKHALEPSKDEKKLVGRIYKKQNIPLLDSTTIASQMLGLNFGELEELTQMGKVPMVTTDEEEPAPPSVPETKETGVGAAPVPTKKESVDRNQKKI